MTRQDRPPKSLGDALERLAGELGLDQRRPGVTVQERWPEVAGDEVAAHATPRHLDEGILTVEVDDPAWATHLRYLGPALARGLNDAAGEEIVAEIRIVVGRPGGPARSG